MSQPLDRTQQLEQLGAVDEAAGEFWVASPFQMPQLGHNLSAFEPNRLFLNVNGEWFADASFASGANIDADSRSAIAADFNRDGAVDLLVGSVGGGPLRLFVNQSPRRNHRVQVELVQGANGACAIGARVVVRCGAATITRELFPANGFMGQAPPELLIGIGDATVIDELKVHWPSGATQTFAHPPIDARLRIIQGRDELHSLSF